MFFCKVVCRWPTAKPSGQLKRLSISACMQGFEPGSFDAVFATNVLHATRNMAATLQRCKALLRTGGLLLANELCARTEFLTLTFGLTDGWWLYDDPARRIPGSPLLSRHARVF